MRLIDADALKGAFMEELFVKSGKSVQDIIDEAPTIEPRNIIACEEVDELDMCERMYAETSKETKEKSTIPQLSKTDLISRAEVLKLLDEMEEPEINDYNCTIREHNITLDKVACWVEDLPSVSADRPKFKLELITDIVRQLGHLDDYVANTCDRPKGEWIVENHEVVCSVCGQNNLETDFCPNCGADMRGEK